MPTDDELQHAMISGISFKRTSKSSTPTDGKVRTKAKKKSYITGLHGSGSAKMKAQIRERRANRHKK